MIVPIWIPGFLAFLFCALSYGLYKNFSVNALIFYLIYLVIFVWYFRKYYLSWKEYLNKRKPGD